MVARVEISARRFVPARGVTTGGNILETEQTPGKRLLVKR